LTGAELLQIEKSFDRDVKKIRAKKVLLELKNVISTIEDARSVLEIPSCRKIEGYSSYYRIRVGDYRLGFEKVSNQEVTLIRFLHRKEIYRYFPRG